MIAGRSRGGACSRIISLPRGTLQTCPRLLKLPSGSQHVSNRLWPKQQHSTWSSKKQLQPIPGWRLQNASFPQQAGTSSGVPGPMLSGPGCRGTLAGPSPKQTTDAEHPDSPVRRFCRRGSRTASSTTQTVRKPADIAKVVLPSGGSGGGLSAGPVELYVHRSMGVGEPSRSQGSVY